MSSKHLYYKFIYKNEFEVTASFVDVNCYDCCYPTRWTMFYAPYKAYFILSVMFIIFFLYMK